MAFAEESNEAKDGGKEAQETKDGEEQGVKHARGAFSDIGGDFFARQSAAA